MRVDWAPRALADILRIVDFIAADNPYAAYRLAARLQSAGDSLAQMPRRGRPSLVNDYRELVAAEPYILVYAIDDAGYVTILRVWHAAQDR